jgi:predicted ABC-type ATPase
VSQQLPWFLEKADFALIYDNRTVPVLVGRKQNGLIEIDPSAPPEIKTAVDTLRD